MTVLTSQVDPASPAYSEHREQMLDLVDHIRTLEKGVRDHAARAQGKFDKRGQLMPRERVELLLDPGTPFLELSCLAGYQMHDDDGEDDIAGGGNIVGIGTVSGVRVMIHASQSAIKGGSVTPMGLRKSLRAQEIALQQRLPMINLVESGGANLLHQSEIFIEGGRSFANMARLSARGIPQITIVHGSSTAGGAYLPGLSDYVIMVQGRAEVYLAGPPLVKAALGEDAKAEELGGADMHFHTAGTAEYLAHDDAHGIQIAREVVASLGWNESLPPEQLAPPAPPRFPIDELCGVVPADPKQPYDVREVIARLVDDSRFLEFKAGFGPETVCGHARIEGRQVGLLGNNGPIFPSGSVKAAQFIQLCCQSGTPLVFLMNTTGYMVGTEAEQAGAVKHGSKMIQAVANATVPRITIVLGGSYGAGNYGMCGRGYDPDFLFSWPSAKVAVMGADQAAEVMKIITRKKWARLGIPNLEEQLQELVAHVAGKLNSESSALFATARLWDDGIIDPRDTRRVLAQTLAICTEARRRTLHPNTFGVARG